MVLGSIILVVVHLLFSIPSLNSLPVAIGLVVVQEILEVQLLDPEAIVQLGAVNVPDI